MRCVLLRCFFLVCVGPTAACVEDVPEGQFTLRVSADVQQGVTASVVMLRPGSVRLHVRHTPRSAGWTAEELDDRYWRPISSLERDIDLLTLTDGATALVSSVSSFGGSFDHILLELEGLEAFDSEGLNVPCKNVIEPIALDLTLMERKSLAVELVLQVVADWPEEGHCSVLAKDAFIL